MQSPTSLLTPRISNPVEGAAARAPLRRQCIGRVSLAGDFVAFLATLLLLSEWLKLLVALGAVCFCRSIFGQLFSWKMVALSLGADLLLALMATGMVNKN